MFAIRITNAPFLFLICLHERKYLWSGARQLTPPRKLGWIASFERLGPHKDLSAVFDADPPQGKSTLFREEFELPAMRQSK